MLFQSTLPVWGATSLREEITMVRKNFNPRSPCGERLLIHNHTLTSKRFQSTLPVWGATILREIPAGTEGISIHAPRVGSDT